MQVLLENHWQARKVRWLTWGLALWAVAWLVWAWSIFGTYGMAPDDGGFLKPWPERLAIAAVIAVVGALPLAGMIVYASAYLLRIERDRDDVILTTLGVLAPRQHRFRVSEFRPTYSHDGQMVARSIVNAPWMTLRVTSRRLPFVADLQAERIEDEEIAALGRSADVTERHRAD